MFISDITYTFSEKVYVYPDIHVHLEQKKPWQRDRKRGICVLNMLHNPLPAGLGTGTAP